MQGGTKLWFKRESCGQRCRGDTMRIIKGDHSEENNCKGNGVAGNVEVRQRRHINLVKRTHQGYHVDDDVDDSPENDLVLNVDHVFEADECDAIRLDVTRYVEETEIMLFKEREKGETSVPKLISCIEVYSTQSSCQACPRILQLKVSHLKESVETVREIVEEARVVKPLDNALNYACQYTKLSQELLEYFEQDQAGLESNGKLFANVGYQWRSTGKKFTFGKLNCGYQWRPTGKKFALGELCPLTKLSVQCSIITANYQDPNKNWGTEIPNSPHSSVFNCRSYRSSFGYMRTQAAKNIDGESSKAQEFVEKFIGVIQESTTGGLGHNLFLLGQFCDFLILKLP
ncbi:hypothetical protein Tco_0468994 [Tanacetum coccineum]